MTIRVVGNRRKRTLQDAVRATVGAGAALYSDDLASYKGLQRDYAHQTVNHAIRNVEGRVHINTLENFWAVEVGPERHLRGGGAVPPVPLPA